MKKKMKKAFIRYFTVTDKAFSEWYVTHTPIINRQYLNTYQQGRFSDSWGSIEKINKETKNANERERERDVQ